MHSVANELPNIAFKIDLIVWKYRGFDHIGEAYQSLK